MSSICEATRSDYYSLPVCMRDRVGENKKSLKRPIYSKKQECSACMCVSGLLMCVCVEKGIIQSTLMPAKLSEVSGAELSQRQEHEGSQELHENSS